MKRYHERDKKALEAKNHDNNLDLNLKTIKDSQEVVLLRSYRWIILKNDDDINYSANRYCHRLLKLHVDTYTIEIMFFALEDDFEKIRDDKEKYIIFNHLSFGISHT